MVLPPCEGAHAPFSEPHRLEQCEQALSSVGTPEQLHRAIDHAQAALRPMDAERLRSLVTRLTLHYGGDLRARELGFYMNTLRHYPEDLLCAAYYHLVRSSGNQRPTTAMFSAFMQPEYARREAQLHTLLQLRESLGEMHDA
jgi:hypothetical protein